VTESSSDFRDTLLELIETSPEPTDHPSADQWLAYQRGKLSAAEEARLQEHLVRCRDCFDLAAAAASFAEPDDSNVREISSGPRRRPSGRFRLPTVLAASFFVALVGLAAWSLRLQSDLEALRAPRPNAPIFDLSAGERLATPASAEKTLSAETRMLVIHPPGGLPLYRLALRDAATGREMWSYDAMKPDEDLALTLAFPAGLRPGHYRLELSDGGGKKVLQTYRLRVVEAGRGG
jgi:hypothetical protein